jgi:transaldolase
MPSTEVLADIDMLVDCQKMEQVLMDEGIKKFADPQKALLAQIAEKRRQLQPAGAR